MKKAGKNRPENDWSTLLPGQQINLHHDRYLPIAGVLDACTDDCSVIWVRMNDGAGRRLIHREDGYRLELSGGQG